MACFGGKPKGVFVSKEGPPVLRPQLSILAAACIALAALAGQGASAPMSKLAAPATPPGAVNTGHLQAQLVAQTTGVAPGGVAQIAISQSIAKGWHTYWRNPGDSGQATSAKWSLPAGWSVGDIVWPAPERLPLGPLMNYGYVGQVLLPVALKVPASARPGTTETLSAAVTFLVCAEICIPEDATLSISIPVVAGAPAADPQWGAAIAKTLADAPRPSGFKAVTAWDGQGPDRVLKLAVIGDPLKGADLSHAYVFPYDPKVLDHAAHQNVERGPEGLTLTLKSVSEDDHAAPALTGVLSLGGRAWEIAAAPGVLPAAARGLGEVVTVKPVDTLQPEPQPPPSSPPSPPAHSLSPGLALAILAGVLVIAGVIAAVLRARSKS
jgi:DsbC/DsbD-like thiol-disulfide interchange protein